MLKLSYYTLFSDELNSSGDTILYCSRSGETFLVSKELKAKLVEGNFDSISETFLSQLISAKGIVPEEEIELQTIRKENKDGIIEKTSSELYVVIQPTANCQLGCYYCGQTHSKDTLSADNTLNILNRIKDRLDAGNFTSLFIGWFGAEPLMGLSQIRLLTTELKKLTASRGMRYASKLVTNGLSLKSKIYHELATELSVTQVEVTLDGTSEYHDTHRFMKDGGKSFDLIYKNLTDILNRPDYEEMNCRITIRCNVSKDNWGDVSNLIQKLSRDGFQKKILYFYTIGIYSWSKNHAHINSLTKEEFAKKEIDWILELMEAGFTPSIIPKRKKEVCAAVSPNFEMYDTFGNVFNCTEVAYAPAYEGTPYVLGNIKNPEHISSHRPLNDWNDTLLTGEFPCTTCKVLPVCGGSCPKSWHEDMRACPPFKFNYKEKLAIAYIRSRAKLSDLSKTPLSIS